MGKEKKAPLRKGEVSRRPVRAIGLLLVLQVVGLIALGVFEFSQVDWRHMRPEWNPPREVAEALATVLFAPPAVLALLAAFGFLVLDRRGWLLAALSQGLSLAICLWLYSEWRVGFVYPVMVYCILMILYLNSHDVRMVFGARRPAEQRREEARGA
ncbi:MAG: hypothetical protein WKF44_01500 [Rubrobacteraceae bacterium]